MHSVGWDVVEAGAHEHVLGLAGLGLVQLLLHRPLASAQQIAGVPELGLQTGGHRQLHFVHRVRLHGSDMKGLLFQVNGSSEKYNFYSLILIGFLLNFEGSRNVSWVFFLIRLDCRRPPGPNWS